MVLIQKNRGRVRMRGPGKLAAIIVAFIATPAFGQQANRLEQFADWGAYAATGTAKICFAVSQPKDSRPKGVRRGPIYFYISRWPADQVENEVSVKMGYPFAEGAKVTVTIDAEKFELFTKEEGAWLESPEEEKKLVEALRKGSKMLIEGTSMRGTDTSDDYSLHGAADAIDRMARECSG